MVEKKTEASLALPGHRKLQLEHTIQSTIRLHSAISLAKKEQCDEDADVNGRPASAVSSFIV